MKLISNVFVSKVEDQYVAVATGKAAKKFSGMVQMNETSAFVVNLLQKRTTQARLEEALKAEYGITDEVAHRNVEGILSKLRETGWLDE